MFSTENAAQIAWEIYGIEASVEKLPGEIDLNFRLHAHNGHFYTLKIAHAGCSFEELDMQNAAIAHLHSQAQGLAVPFPIADQAGQFISSITDRLGAIRFVRLLTWVPGRPLASVDPHTPELLGRIGQLLGKLSAAFASFDHPAAHRFIKWDPAQAGWTAEQLALIDHPAQRELAQWSLQCFETEAQPLFPQLRSSVNYNDANDYNILINEDYLHPDAPGVIDFGDLVFTHTVNELAIGIAYGAMGKPDPLSAACALVRGYHQVFPLTEPEIDALYALVGARLLISVTCSAINRVEEPENAYLQISDQPAWELLAQWRSISSSLARYAFRQACNLEPCPLRSHFETWVSQHPTGTDSLVPHDLSAADVHWLDLSVGSLDLGNMENILDADRLHQRIQQITQEKKARVALGHYNETRALYTSDAFAQTGNQGPEWRSVHIGIDVFMAPDTPVFAPLDGVVHSLADNQGDRDYGPTIILVHEPEPGLRFYTLYGHLSRSSLEGLQPGQAIQRGQVLCTIGDMPYNGNWSPHLHFQIMLDMLDKSGDFPGVALPDQRALWTSICPDPWWLLRGQAGPLHEKNQLQEIQEGRKKHLSPNLSISYQHPLHIVRGYGAYLYENSGRRYLDTVNNVAHVGHEHPRVVRAGQRQMAVLNTNTRYLHEEIVAFSEELLATLPPPLEVVFFVNSGSEANELALRLAKTYSGQQDMLVMEVGYHGNTNACVEVSSYKFDGPGGKGAASHIHTLPIPDGYRGLYRYEDPQATDKYARHAREVLDALRNQGKGPAAFLCESVISCGGQVVLPPGYLKTHYEIVRQAGGVCIADEVQTGFGRAGTHFWAFETQGVVPDIVTMGKPIGNGHPLAAVATTRAIADAFHNGMEYFNTFGGNPVSCAIGREVLRVIHDEQLQQQALQCGEHLTYQLKALQHEFPIIGDIRGPGLFLGFELVHEAQTRKPAPGAASYLANRMRDLGVLMSTDGPFHNVLKIKPPLVFSTTQADFLIENLHRVLREDYMRMSYKE